LPGPEPMFNPRPAVTMLTSIAIVIEEREPVTLGRGRGDR
jgi:hypothetical protein